MIVGNRNDSGSHADRFRSDVSRHHFWVVSTQSLGGRKEGKKGRRTRTDTMWRVGKG